MSAHDETSKPTLWEHVICAVLLFLAFGFFCWAAYYWSPEQSTRRFYQSMADRGYDVPGWTGVESRQTVRRGRVVDKLRVMMSVTTSEKNQYHFEKFKAHCAEVGISDENWHEDDWGYAWQTWKAAIEAERMEHGR